MSLLNLFNLRRRRLLSAVRLYQAGRTRVIWRNGVLYGGGTLFLLFNALDYLIEPAAKPTPSQLTWFFLALLASLVLGYLYGLFTWRSLSRLFANQGIPTSHPVQ
jgi:hypothetical protein